MRLLCVLLPTVLLLIAHGAPHAAPDGRLERLPAPRLSGPLTLEAAIAQRRTLREFAPEPLSPAHLGQLCWAGQGVTEPQRGLRSVPSAGALYPVELFVATAEGVSRYLPREHALRTHRSGDHRPGLRRAALDQDSIAAAPACFIITAVVQRSAAKYGDRAERYCFLEAGHVAQNLLLQAAALQLAGVPIGAFDDRKVAELLELPPDHQVLYLLPIGTPAAR